MDRLSPVTTGRRLLWIGAMLLGCTAAASLGRALTSTVTAALAGAPIGWLDLLALPSERVDLYLPLFLVSILLIELVQNGWQKSALRRLLGQSDASTRTDLAYFIIAVTRLMPVIAFVLALGANRFISGLTDLGIELRLCGELPLAVAVPGVFAVQSFVGYWIHRVFHTPLFWPLHAVHHAAADFNVVTTVRHHPIDGVIGTIALPLMPALLGFSVEAISISVYVIAGYTIYVHSNLPTSAFLERWVAFGPHGHGIHHGRDPGCFNTNFGDFVIWDRLLGTYKTDVPEPLVYGCADPEGIYQSGHPFRDMIAVQAGWLRNLWRVARAGCRPS